MSRLPVAILAALVFAALLILDPVAVARLLYACALGQCGVRPRWLLAGLAAIACLCIGARALRSWRRRPVAKAVQTRKPAVRRAAAASRSAPARAAPRKARRRTS